MHVYQAGATTMHSVDFAPDGKTLALGCNDRTVRMWEPATGHRWTMPHQQRVTDVRFSPDGQTVASASSDRTIKIWNVRQVQDERTLHGYQGERSSLAFSRDGKILAYPGIGNAIHLCNPETGAVRSVPGRPEEKLVSLAFSVDGTRLVGGGEDGIFKVWDAATTEELARFDAQRTGLFSLGLSPDGTTLVAGLSKGSTTVWDLDTRQLRTTLKPARGRESVAVAWSRDGKWLAAEASAWVQFWDGKTLERRHRFKVSEAGWVWVLVFSPDGQKLVTSGDGGVLKCWEAATGRLLATYHGHTAVVLGAAFFPDGKTLASASEDGTVKLWDVPTGQERLTLLGHSHHVTSVAVAPDGKTLASGSRDGTVKLWRAAHDPEAVGLNAELDPDDPSSPAAQIHLANALLRVPRPAEAEQAFRLAISRLEELQARVPVVVPQYRQLRAENKHRLAVLLIKGKRMPEAEAPLLEAIEGYEEILRGSPHYEIGATQLRECYVLLAQLLAAGDQPEKAIVAYETAIGMKSVDPLAYNNLAWLLATSPVVKLDPDRAVELAERAVELQPTAGGHWNTLGVSQYRAGEWQAAVESLGRSQELLKDRHFGFNAFFLAMAHWRLDRKDEARQLFAAALQWMAQHAKDDPELIRFRDEAAALVK